MRQIASSAMARAWHRRQTANASSTRRPRRWHLIAESYVCSLGSSLALSYFRECRGGSSGDVLPVFQERLIRPGLIARCANHALAGILHNIRAAELVRCIGAAAMK